MTQRFSFNELAGTDINNCPYGFAWRVFQHAYASELILKADPQDANHLFFVTLSGERAFNTVWGRAQPPGNSTVIPIQSESLVIELPDSPRNSGKSEVAGALVVAPEDKFIATRNVVNGEFAGFVYVSLQNFTVHHHLPQRIGVFDKWRLTTSDTNMIDRSTYISMGDWI